MNGDDNVNCAREAQQLWYPQISITLDAPPHLNKQPTSSDISAFPQGKKELFKFDFDTYTRPNICHKQGFCKLITTWVKFHFVIVIVVNLK